MTKITLKTTMSTKPNASNHLSAAGVGMSTAAGASSPKGHPNCEKLVPGGGDDESDCADEARRRERARHEREACTL